MCDTFRAISRMDQYPVARHRIGIVKNIDTNIHQ
jgi:hypothetical protein